MRPLLAACLIVKNEAHSIRATLESLKGAVDIVAVLDTGPADDETASAARGSFAEFGLDGWVYHNRFIDFSEARNLARGLAETWGILRYGDTGTALSGKESPAFTLTFSADESLTGGEALRAFLDAHRDSGADCFNVLVVNHDDGTSYPSPRITRTGSAWRYEGVVHEQLVHPTLSAADAPVIPGVIIDHRASDPERRQRRLREFDLPALEKAVREGTRERRLLDLFFLAQTHENIAATEDRSVPGGAFLHHATQAMARYMERVEGGGDPDERNLAYFRYLNIACLLGVHDNRSAAENYAALAQRWPFPEAVFKAAVHVARIDPFKGREFAVAAARVARDAVTTPPRLPTNPSMQWRAQLLAAACAKAVGAVDMAREHGEAAAAAGAPRDAVAEVLK